MLFHRGFAIVGRITLVVGGVVLALYAAWLFGAFTGMVPLPVLSIDTGAIERFFGTLRVSTPRAVIVTVIMASIATLGVALAVIGVRGASSLARLPMPAPADGEPLGAVAVSNASIRALGRKAAERRSGVHATASGARLRRDGWQIDLRITVPRQLSVPEVVAEIRTELASSLERQTGVALADLRVRAELEHEVLREGRRVH